MPARGCVYVCGGNENRGLWPVAPEIAAEAVERDHQEADEGQDVADVDAGKPEEDFFCH